jgi:hypothetical protein
MSGATGRGDEKGKLTRRGGDGMEVRRGGGGAGAWRWCGTWKREIKVRFGNEPHDTTAGRETGALGWIGVCNIYFIAPCGRSGAEAVMSCLAN